MSETVSALMPVHDGVDPDHLRRALESLADQTRPLDEIVLVLDGPVSAAHHAAIDASQPRLTNVVRVALPTNQGAGVANQAGLLRCSGTWVLKADADDVSLPVRLEAQLAHAAETGADVVGSAMWEFQGSEDNVVSVRVPPLTHRAIAGRMRWNNPMNHPSTMYRTQTAREAGGYGDLRFMQDYDLFARMLMAGAAFANLSEPLVLFRTGDAVMSRRRSSAMRRCEWELQRNLSRYGVVRSPRRYVNFVARQGARMLPHRAMTGLHGLLFSGSVKTRGSP